MLFDGGARRSVSDGVRCQRITVIHFVSHGVNMSRATHIIMNIIISISLGSLTLDGDEEMSMETYHLCLRPCVPTSISTPIAASR